MKKPRCANQQKMAEALGIHKVYLNAILKGRNQPSPLLARKIERLTGGKIRASSLRPDVFGPEK